MNILTDTDILLHGTDVLYVPDIQMGDPRMYFWQVYTPKSRPAQADISNMVKVEETSNIPTHVVTMNDDVGYLIFAESVLCPLRLKWYINIINRGNIGGSHEGYDANLFPDPIIQNFDGRLWRVYISSWQTQLDDPIQFIAQ